MPDKSSSKVFPLLPLTLRLETLGGVGSPLVLRGTPLPVTRSEIFTTAADNQSSVDVSLWIGERPLAKDNRKVGTFHLEGIPAAPRAVPKIAVEFSVDSNSKVTAKASVQGTSLSHTQTFDPAEFLSADRIAKALAEAELARESDDKKILQVETKNRAINLISKAEIKLSKAADDRLSKAVADLGLALEKDDANLIREKSDTLEQRLTSGIDLFGADLFSSFFSKSAPTKSHTVQEAADTPSKHASANAGQTVRETNRKSVQKRKDVPQGLTAQPPVQQLGKVFGGASFTLDPQLCFVLMPFSADLQPIYEDHIKPTVVKAGLRCERADDIHGISMITWDIWERINRARFVIADLTNLNANVFYELGLAHAIGKDAILLTQSMDFVPFDLKAIRCIVYDSTSRGVKKLEAGLSLTIDAVMKAG